MNYKKLTIGITAINILGWAMIELWSKRYADMNISNVAAFLIGLHLLGYYILIIASGALKSVPDKITPVNCPGHDWQKAKYSKDVQECTRCGAERGE